MAERVGAGEMPEIPAYEGKIEAVVVADEEGATLDVACNPARECFHDALRIIEGQRLCAREAGDCQRLRDPLLGNRLKAAIEARLQYVAYQHSAEADHAVVAGDRTVRLHVHHHIGHRACLRGSPPRGPYRRQGRWARGWLLCRGSHRSIVAPLQYTRPYSHPRSA